MSPELSRALAKIMGRAVVPLPDRERIIKAAIPDDVKEITDLPADVQKLLKNLEASISKSAAPEQSEEDPIELIKRALAQLSKER